MKIVRLIENLSPQVSGGLEPNAFHLSLEQIKQGHQVEIFCFNEKKKQAQKIDQLTINYLKRPKIIRFLGGVTFFNEIAKRNIEPDIIHGFQAIPFGWFFPFIKNKVKAKYVLSVHSSIMPQISSKIKTNEFHYLIKNIAQKVDLILPIAEFIKRELIEVGIPPEKIKVIPSGLNLKGFKVNKAKKNKKIFTLLYVGRFSKQKGLCYLIEALKLLNFDNFELLLAGGKKEDDDYNNILYLINKLQLKKRIVVLEPMPYHKITMVYQRADVFVLPSILEPLGKVLFEAEATATPIIATRQGGVTDIIKNNYNGILVPPKNSRAIAQQITRIYQDGNLRKFLVSNGLEEVKKFDWRLIAKNYSKTFQELLKKK